MGFNTSTIAKKDVEKIVTSDAKNIAKLIRSSEGYEICANERKIRSAIEHMVDHIAWCYADFDTKIEAINALKMALSHLEEAINCVIESPAQSLNARVNLLTKVLKAKDKFKEADPINSAIFGDLFD